MIFLEKINDWLCGLDEKDFYKYFGIFFGAIALACGLILFFHFRAINDLERRSADINSLREEAQKIFSKAETVKQQQATVDATLAKEKDFKIGGYFKDLLVSLNLLDKKTVENPSHIDLGKGYTETILNTKLTEMNTKQLCEILDAIDENERIYTKELDIVKSAKKPNAIDVTLTIATLQKIE
jgi:beta-lactamase regulating signal transducer with metallopeptidase domain